MNDVPIAALFNVFGSHFRIFGSPVEFHFAAPIMLIFICFLLILAHRHRTRYSSMDNSRDTGVAYLFLLLGGVLGLHKFYLNRPGMGFLYLFTGGLFFIGLLYDLFTLPAQVRRCNSRLAFAAPFAALYQPPPAAGAASPEAVARAGARIDAFTRRLDDLETLIYSRRQR